MPPTEFYLLSPDGFTLYPNESYTNDADANSAIEKWMKRYEAQGYYSSNNGKIPLSELKSCIIKSQTPYKI